MEPAVSPPPSFDYTLIDRRHRAFAEGRSPRLMSTYRILAQHGLFRILPMFIVAGLILFWGARSLLYDATVEWREATAEIVAITPVQSDGRFNFWHIYRFDAEDGSRRQGKLVLDNQGSYRIGDRLPVIYVASDPDDNRFANESLPRSVRDWFFVALAAVLFGFGVGPLRRGFADRAALKRLTREGRLRRGRISGVSPVALTLQVSYGVEADPSGQPAFFAVAEVPIAHLATGAPPPPDTVVAVLVSDQAVRLL